MFLFLGLVAVHNDEQFTDQKYLDIIVLGNIVLLVLLYTHEGKTGKKYRVRFCFCFSPPVVNVYSVLVRCKTAALDPLWRDVAIYSFRVSIPVAGKYVLFYFSYKWLLLFGCKKNELVMFLFRGGF